MSLRRALSAVCRDGGTPADLEAWLLDTAAAQGLQLHKVSQAPNTLPALIPYCQEAGTRPAPTPYSQAAGTGPALTPYSQEAGTGPAHIPYSISLGHFINFIPADATSAITSADTSCRISNISSFIPGSFNYTLSGRIGKVVASHAEGCKVADRIPALAELHRFILCTGAQGVLPVRVRGVTSQLDLPSLMPLSVADYGRLQLAVPHWAVSVDFCK